jgi:hypothetical protein
MDGNEVKYLMRYGVSRNLQRQPPTFVMGRDYSKDAPILCKPFPMPWVGETGRRPGARFDGYRGFSAACLYVRNFLAIGFNVG